MGLKEAGLRGSLRNVSTPSAIPDSVVAYGGDDFQTYIHELDNGSAFDYSPLDESSGSVSDVSLSDGHIAYTGAFGDENCYIHNLSDGSELSFSPLTESNDRVQGVGLTDEYVAYGGWDENVYVHDISDGSLVHTLTEATERLNAVSIL